MFTRQHYKAIAEIVKQNEGTVNNIMVYIKRQRLCDDLADYFAADNPRFDREKFLEACGL